MSKEEIKQLFKQLDNGDNHLSLAKIDRAVVHFSLQFSTNKKAIMRAYKPVDTKWFYEKIVQLLRQYDAMSKIFEELDTNNDHREEFDTIDSNDGGYILFDEVTNF